MHTIRNFIYSYLVIEICFFYRILYKSGTVQNAEQSKTNMVRRGSFISPDFYVKNKLDLYLNLPAFLAAVEFAAAFVAVVGSVDFVNVGCFVVVE